MSDPNLEYLNYFLKKLPENKKINDRIIASAINVSIFQFGIHLLAGFTINYTSCVKDVDIKSYDLLKTLLRTQRHICEAQSP